MSDPLVSGIGVCPGVVRGEAKVLRSERDIEELRPGKIIVIPHSSPLYAVALMSASGVICENGGRLSHICTIAMEMGIPCITQATRAMEIILDGHTVFLDASSGLVYDDSIKGL